jgi:hypothetical protein
MGLKAIIAIQMRILGHQVIGKLKWLSSWQGNSTCCKPVGRIPMGWISGGGYSYIQEKYWEKYWRIFDSK